jgi:hypothetical protein
MGKPFSVLLLSVVFAAWAFPVYAQTIGPGSYQPPTIAIPGGPQVPGGKGPKGGCALNEVPTDLGCFPNTPVGFVSKFYGIGLGFVAGVSLISLMLGGYNIMTSRGEIRRLNIGKSYIFYAITGLLLAIFGFVFIQTVVRDILKVPGFK